VRATIRGGGGESTGQTLTITQMYALARGAGLSTENAVVAAAVGMAESSGQTDVTSKNPDGGMNVGIWQEDTKGVGSGKTVAELQDPATNAQVMAKGSDNGTNWGPWATYASGAYTAYLTQAKAAQSSESSGGSGWLGDILGGIGDTIKAELGFGGPVANAADKATGSLGSLLQLPSQVTDFLTALEQPVKAAMWLASPSNWARIIAGVFGFLLLAAGLVTIGMSA
jgi:hypothetical protein